MPHYVRKIDVKTSKSLYFLFLISKTWIRSSSSFKLKNKWNVQILNLNSFMISSSRFLNWLFFQIWSFKGTWGEISSNLSRKDGFLGLKVFNFDNFYIFSCSRNAQVYFEENPQLSQNFNRFTIPLTLNYLFSNFQKIE